jgi:predicted SAM-dependent methyltransferase
MSIKLNLGSGDVRIPGFTNVDLYDDTADVKADIANLPFNDGSVDKVVAYQVIEHVHYAESQKVFDEIYRVLKKGGSATIETPDIDIVCRKILEEGLTDKWMHNLVGEYHRPWDKDRYTDWYHNAASIHRNPWNFERLKQCAEKSGFREVRRRKVANYYPCEENMSVELIK